MTRVEGIEGGGSREGAEGEKKSEMSEHNDLEIVPIKSSMLMDTGFIL